LDKLSPFFAIVFIIRLKIGYQQKELLQLCLKYHHQKKAL